MKIRKNFSINELKFQSFIETKLNYEYYIAKNTHIAKKLLKENKFFLFSKEKEEPIEEIKDYYSDILYKEITFFLTKNGIDLKKEKKFKIFCSKFDVKEKIIELSLKFKNKNIIFFFCQKKETGNGFKIIKSFLNITNEKFLIKLFYFFLLRKELTYEYSNEIFIPGNVPSSKNSKQMTSKGILLHSKTVRKYLENYSFWWTLLEPDFKKLVKEKTIPYNISFTFVRDSKRSFDYINIAQLPLDLMQKYNWLQNDDVYNVKPFFEDFKIDKLNPGVFISLK